MLVWWDVRRGVGVCWRQCIWIGEGGGGCDCGFLLVLVCAYVHDVCQHPVEMCGVISCTDVHSFVAAGFESPVCSAERAHPATRLWVRIQGIWSAVVLAQQRCMLCSPACVWLPEAGVDRRLVVCVRFTAGCFAG